MTPIKYVTPTEARYRADRLADGDYDGMSDVSAALRSLADQVEALEGQALSSIEREEYFEMKKDAERYRWIKNACLITLPNGYEAEDEAQLDRAREATC